MDDLICNKCGTEKQCLGGCSAHPDNWYCPQCDTAEDNGWKLRAVVSTMRSNIKSFQDISRPDCDDAWIISRLIYLVGKAERLIGLTARDPLL